MNETQTSTCQTELERAFKNLQSIEDKLWEAEPVSEKRDCPNDKIIILKEDIYQIANRLEIINQKLSLIGK